VIATCQPGDIISIQLPGHPGNATIARVTVHTPVRWQRRLLPA
jgi:hypothetical protein